MPFFEAYRSEVEKQANGQVEKTQVREHLLLVHRDEFLGGFQFDDHLSFHHQVHAASFLDSNAIPLEGNRLLSLNVQATFYQCMGENGLINRLQQARANPGYAGDTLYR